MDSAESPRAEIQQVQLLLVLAYIYRRLTWKLQQVAPKDGFVSLLGIQQFLRLGKKESNKFVTV